MHIELGWFCNFGLRVLLLLSLFEPYPWASAVLIDELDVRSMLTWEEGRPPHPPQLKVAI